MAKRYDAIVVGARCAGSPTAMLLARKGYRVLLVDKSTFPSDIMSTHFIHLPGVAALERWGLLEGVADSGCPAVERYIFDFGPIVISGRPRPSNGVAVAYGPRRTVLDSILIEAAAAAGAEVREGFILEDLVAHDGRVVGTRGRTNGGAVVQEDGLIVVGADGRHSRVAKAVEPVAYQNLPPLGAGYYAYWSGVPTDGFEVFDRPYRSFGAIPTNDGLTCVFAQWPIAEFATNRADVEGNYLKTLDLAPAFADRVHAGRRETRFVGTADVANYMRKPYGPGWALVGDAGYNKDPSTAQGISDAFRDAELLADAIDTWLSVAMPFDLAMAGYQAKRDEASLPMFELTCQIAALEPPTSELEALLAAVAVDEASMDDFASMIAGTLPVPEFFAARQPDLATPPG
jgi:flavin-dependent dehydrogenase